MSSFEFLTQMGILIQKWEREQDQIIGVQVELESPSNVYEWNGQEFDLQETT